MFYPDLGSSFEITLRGKDGKIRTVTIEPGIESCREGVGGSTQDDILKYRDGSRVMTARGGKGDVIVDFYYDEDDDDYDDDSDDDDRVVLGKKHEELFAKHFDVLVGNTAIMLGRDDIMTGRLPVVRGASKYECSEGRFTYKTLSNFWLVYGYQISSLMLGLARVAVDISMSIIKDERNSKEPSPYRVVIDKTNFEDIEKAIRTTDYELAKKNWDKIKEPLIEIMGGHYGSYPLSKGTLRNFDYFLDKGLHYWFGKRAYIFSSWSEDKQPFIGCGWEMFLSEVVGGAMDCCCEVKWSIVKDSYNFKITLIEEK